MNFIRNEYFQRGFQEVMSPIVAKGDLWGISGYLDKYKENMFCFECDEKDYYISPMNCPKACMMFKHRNRSYRELPLRLADFGCLHRNELSGSLTSLFRNRLFRQDDAHIFCRIDQIKNEIKDALDFLSYVYSKFGFQFEVGLSTRPDHFIGDINIWDKAEKELIEILQESKLNWNIKEKDGAFYGPKIDIHLTDSLNRVHQCGTIQLDFNLPEKFELEYIDENGNNKRPVIIHRAIYGSFERFIGILIEHYNGKFPFWLNHSPIIILPVSEKFIEYANKIKKEIATCNNYNFHVIIDDSDNTLLKKKILMAQNKKCNYILVVGQKELDTNTVNVRYRDNKIKKVVSVPELLQEFIMNLQNFS